MIDARDVTERKWSAERLQRSLEALLAIHDVGRVLGSNLEQQAIAAALLDGAHRVAPFDAAALRLGTGEGGTRASRPFGSREAWESARKCRAARAARTTALQTGTPQFFRLPRKRSGGGDTEACALPLRVQDRVVGMLELYGADASGQWPIDELTILADQAASALDRARLYQALSERERRLEHLVRRLLLNDSQASPNSWIAFCSVSVQSQPACPACS